MDVILGTETFGIPRTVTRGGRTLLAIREVTRRVGVTRGLDTLLF